MVTSPDDGAEVYPLLPSLDLDDLRSWVWRLPQASLRGRLDDKIGRADDAAGAERQRLWWSAVFICERLATTELAVISAARAAAL